MLLKSGSGWRAARLVPVFSPAYRNSEYFPFQIWPAAPADRHGGDVRADQSGDEQPHTHSTKHSHHEGHSVAAATGDPWDYEAVSTIGNE